MNDYISRDVAICIADYAADEHPYDKNPEKPETFSEYNQGWHDACDYIRERLENAQNSDVAPVRRGRWEQCFEDWRKQIEGDKCSACGFEHYGCSIGNFNYCPHCGARMNLGDDENG